MPGSECSWSSARMLGFFLAQHTVAVELQSIKNPEGTEKTAVARWGNHHSFNQDVNSLVVLKDSPLAQRRCLGTFVTEDGSSFYE
jgi:hypothetical protein